MNQENLSLRQAIEDLNNVNSYGHGKSGKYQRMERALNDLTAVIAKYYPKEDQEAPALSDAALKEIRDAYSMAIRRCNEYTSGKGDTRRSGYGQGRLNCVKAISRILSQDYLAIADAKGHDQTSLPALISRARITETQITEEELRFARGGMTNRIPLAIETSGGICEGFFTPDKKQPDSSELLNDLAQRYDFLNGPVAGLTNGIQTKNEKEKDRFLLNLANKFDQLKNYSATLNSNIQNNSISFMNYFGDLIDAHVTDPDENAELRETLEDSADARKTFYRFVMEAGEAAGTQIVNRDKAGIQRGQDIPKRNVSTSRMADLLGMGHLVARAERMQLTDKEGNVITGVFQERASGSDSHRLKDDDPLYELGDHNEMLDDPEIIRQISDIQVMDYIIGNPDRHEGNLIYQMQEVDGKMKLVGVKAIDNDMSMGTHRRGDFTGGGCYITLPEDMKVIRRERADAIMAMDEAKIRLNYQDMNFTEEELAAAVSRVKDVQQAIREKKIEVLEDHEFTKYKFQDLRNRGKAPKNPQAKVNLFDIVGDMAANVRYWQPDGPAKEVRYNAAQSLEKQYRREGVIYASDLTAQLDQLKEIQAKFVSSDIKVHRDSGPFKLMKTNLNDCITLLQEIKSRYQGAATLSEEDAEKLEGAYRQLRNASAGYAAGHANPSSPMGQARKQGALDMQDLWPPRLEAPRDMVHEINLEDMMNQNGVQIRDHNSSIRNSSRKQANASNASIDDDDFEIAGIDYDRKSSGQRRSSNEDDDDFIMMGEEMDKGSQQNKSENSKKSSGMSM